MASVGLKGHLNFGSVGVSRVQLCHIGQTPAVASADVKVQFWQQELHRGPEGWSGVSKQREGRGELSDWDRLLDADAIVEQLWGEGGFRIATKEDVLDAISLGHNVAARSVERGRSRGGIFDAERC